MIRTKINQLIYCLTISILLFATCRKEENITTDYSKILLNLANDVILVTYAELDTKTQDLVTALTNLETHPSETNLELARQA